MDQRERIAGAFDAVAETYDKVGVDLFQPIATRLVEELAPRVGERILDVGCGPGEVLLRVAAAVGPTGAATGLDLAPRMIEAAAREAERADLSVTLMVGDAQAPDLPGESFDAVTASLVLFFLPDPAAALRSWRTLLRQGGRIAVSTFGRYNPEWEPVDAVFTPYLPPGMLDARTSGTRGPFASDAGLDNLLADAGFGNVRTVRNVVQVRFDSAEHWLRWTMSTGQRSMWQAVPESERDAVRARAFVAAEATRRVNADGRIGFAQTVRYTVGERSSIGSGGRSDLTRRS